MTAVDYWYSDFKFNWKKFFSKKINSFTLAIGLAYFVSVTILFKEFLFDFELIQGVQLDDYFLRIFPSHDVSAGIFILSYFTVFYNYVILLAYPKTLQNFIIFYATALVMRFITLYFLHLEPPIGIITLHDPILANTTYNDIVIRKDLFFSGHMVAVLCSYFTVPNKTIKNIFLVTSILTGFLLLIQHIHYTVDILGAIVIVYLLYRVYFRKQWQNSKFTYQYSKEIINVL
jgi:hypothetical protein